MSGRCTICQELFDPTEIAALKCGHTFHFVCISQWLQTTPSCPICRRTAKRTTDIIEQLFFDYGEDSMVSTSQSPIVSSSKRVSELSKKVQLLESELSNTTKATKTHEQNAATSQKEVKRQRVHISNLEAVVRTLQNEMTALDGVKEKNGVLRAKNQSLQEQLKKLAAVDMLVNTSKENMDGKTDDCSLDVMKISFGIMKRKYNDLIAEKQSMSSSMKSVDRANVSLEKEKNSLEAALRAAKEEIERLRTEQTGHGKMDDDDASASGLVPSPKRKPNVPLNSLSNLSDSCRIFDLPILRTTNMATRASSIRPKEKAPFHLVADNDDQDVSIIDGHPSFFQSAGATKTTNLSGRTTKRCDGFGGRVVASHTLTTKNIEAKKRKCTPIPKQKSKMPKNLTPKIRRDCGRVNSDDSIIILDDD